MISKLTKSALIAMLTLTLFSAVPRSLRAQEADAITAPAGRLNITWNINLVGPAFNGMTPVGAAEYEVEGTRRRFSAEADNVNLPDGTSLNVYVSGKLVGSFTLTDSGGVLLLDTFAHQKVPTVIKGTTVAIYYGHTKIVSGKF
jgi:hypothetical protein